MSRPFKPLVLSHGWIMVEADSIVSCIALRCRRCRTVKFLPGRRARAPGFLMTLLRFTGRHDLCKRRGGPERDEGDR
jgi:hypothetical protein